MQTTSDGSLGQGNYCRIVPKIGMFALAFGLLFAFPPLLHAGGSCTVNSDCNLPTNYCKPGLCDLFHQCQYQHSDTMCRGSRICIGGTNAFQCCGNCPNGVTPATCTGGTCSTGICAGGTNAGNPCAINSNCPGSTCTQGANHDNLFCNGEEFCNETVQHCDTNPVSCLPPTPNCSETLDACVQCNSSNQCTTPPNLVCNNANGTCVQCASNPDCNDGMFCNGQETCSSNACVAGTPPTCTTKRCFGGTNIGGTCTTNANCPGGGTCQLETCSEVFQGCSQCENDEDCDDGLYCNGQETCNKAGRCMAGTAPVCKRCNGGTFGVCQSDADCPGSTCGPAGSGFCNESEDSCVQCLSDSQCPPDLTYCTNAACVFNSCVQVADPVGRCGDGLFCNGAEVCLSNQIGSVCTNCMVFHPSTCSGGTRNGLSCSLTSDCPGGVCVSHELECKGKVCNSSLSSPPYKSCTTNANCPSGVQCVDACCGAGTAIDCDDGVACTLNKCSEAADSCVTTIPTKTCNNVARTLCETNADCPSPSVCTGLAYCDDGLFCDGQETCTGTGCVNNTPRVCKNREVEISCQTNADCNYCDSGPNEGDHCTVPADCPAGTCTTTTCEVNCNSFTSQCTRGDCNETTDQCVATPIRVGQACEDGTACTINEVCSSGGVCAPNPNIPTTDTYRCVKLEWRNVTPTSVFPGQTVTADLYAVADSCGAAYAGSCPSGNADIVGLRALLKWNSVQLRLDPPSPANPSDPCNSGGNACYRCQTCTGGSNPGAQCVSRCSAGPRYGFACLTNSECSQVCNGGTQNGLPCTTSANCPGGTCGVAATCVSTVNTCLGGTNAGLPCTIPADCPSISGQPPASCSNQYTCQGGGTCSTVPSPSQYDWFSSAFLNDCPASGSAGDGINGPCPYTGFPGNDGNALYTAFDEFLPCMPNGQSYPSCVPTGGLYVTKFRFKALAGGTSVLDFDSCLGSNSKTSVTSSVTPPSPLTSADVLKSVTPSVTITVQCNTNADCEDQNPCTNQTCNTSTHLCVFTNNVGAACDDGLFCTPNDACSLACVGGTNAGKACTSSANCPGGTCGTSAVCIGGTAAKCTGNGTCVGGSNPGAACTSHAQCTNGWCTATTTCDEANDRCAQCLVSTSCKDNNICTQDVCDASGMCQNPAVNCDDGLSCTTDTCAIVTLNPPVSECRHTANNAACATNLFCSAKFCDPTANPATVPTGCVFGNQCVSANGNPCDNPATCNEAADNCGGCLPPTVVSTGSRYLKITPNVAQGATPVAVLLEGDCADSNVACVSKYLSPRCVGGSNDGANCLVDAECGKLCVGGLNNGSPCTTDANCVAGTCRGTCEKGVVGNSAAFMTASSWGTVQAHAGEFRPNGNYLVYSICNFGGTPVVSAPTAVKTPRWGDCNGDNLVDFGDISALVNAFKNVYSAVETYQSTNVLGSGANVCGDVQLGCFGQECISFGDVAAIVDAFKGASFPCPATCP